MPKQAKQPQPRNSTSRTKDSRRGITKHAAPNQAAVPNGSHRGASATSKSSGPAHIHTLADHAMQGSPQRFPYAEDIQKSFGHHSIRHFQAFTDSAAKKHTKSAGAEAMTRGHRTSFAGTPSLHTAAHEAAHGKQWELENVSVPGNVGAAGDKYEKMADEVAERVVQRKSAVDLLDAMANGPNGRRQKSGGSTKKSVQMRRNTSSLPHNHLNAPVQRMPTTSDSSDPTPEDHARRKQQLNARDAKINNGRRMRRLLQLYGATRMAAPGFTSEGAAVGRSAMPFIGTVGSGIALAGSAGYGAYNIKQWHDIHRKRQSWKGFGRSVLRGGHNALNIAAQSANFSRQVGNLVHGTRAVGESSGNMFERFGTHVAQSAGVATNAAYTFGGAAIAGGLLDVGRGVYNGRKHTAHMGTISGLMNDKDTTEKDALAHVNRFHRRKRKAAIAQGIGGLAQASGGALALATLGGSGILTGAGAAIKNAPWLIRAMRQKRRDRAERKHTQTFDDWHADMDKKIRLERFKNEKWRKEHEGTFQGWLNDRMGHDRSAKRLEKKRDRKLSSKFLQPGEKPTSYKDWAEAQRAKLDEGGLGLLGRMSARWNLATTANWDKSTKKKRELSHQHAATLVGMQEHHGKDMQKVLGTLGFHEKYAKNKTGQDMLAAAHTGNAEKKWSELKPHEQKHILGTMLNQTAGQAGIKTAAHLLEKQRAERELEAEMNATKPKLTRQNASRDLTASISQPEKPKLKRQNAQPIEEFINPMHQ